MDTERIEVQDVEQVEVTPVTEAPEGASTLDDILRGGPTNEYAKVLKIGITEAIQSVKATIKLPTSKHSGFRDGFVNFYLGFDKFEAGISTVAWKNKWHWFCNHKIGGATNGDNGAFTQYDYGTTHTLELKRVGSEIIFYVDGSEKERYADRKEYTNGRFIFGAGKGLTPEFLDGLTPSNSAEKLGAFPSMHNQAVLSKMSYVTTGGVTKQVNSSNSKVKIEKMKWPIINGTVYPCKDPQYHTVSTSSFGSGTLYGSIK